MNIVLGILAAVSTTILIIVLLLHRRLEKRLAEGADAVEAVRRDYEERLNRVRQEAQAGVVAAQTQGEQQVAKAHQEAQENLAAAQTLIDQQAAELKREEQRIKAHYEDKAREMMMQSEALVARTLAEVAPLRKYEGLTAPEEEAKRLLEVAVQEADDLRREAESLIEQARMFADKTRSDSSQKAKQLRSEAEALLNRATTEAGRITSEAESRAEKIAGDAYEALRDRATLDHAVKALWNVANGYGDRYVMPTRSILDDLASDFGHTEAGEALRAARDHSRRLVELKQASDCNYVETDRRDRANRFVVDAFNGRVDAILTRVKHDNYGTLAQEVRDAFSLVNLNGLAFRDARILPAYLDARLAELKWATVVQELRLKEREEQRRMREQIREEEKARREYERAMREAAAEQEIIRKAMESAQRQIEHATAEQRAKYELQLSDLSAKLKEAEEKNQRAISMAQQTRRGHVYVISNIGSFGEDIYKIGLTRRLYPQDRIDELGDSSVPFDFDFHAMIGSEDAPALEARLHKHFVLSQVNKVNHRKEFFRATVEQIRGELSKLGLEAQWTMTAEAAEYRQTLAIEKAIKDNPEMREAWVKRQLELEVEQYEEPPEVRGRAMTPERDTAEVGI